MKRFSIGLCFIFLVCVMALPTLTPQAQAYPDRPITLVVPLPPGSAVDTAARLLLEDLKKDLGQEVVILNKPGASLTVGTGLVARSKKDGYTVAYTATSGVVYARVTKPEIVPYDTDKDLEPLGLHLYLPLAIAVQASSPWKTFEEFLDHAKKNPGKVRIGTNGVASIDRFNLEIIQAETGVKFTHIPFKGGDATTASVLGGHVEAISHAYAILRSHVAAGKLRLLLMSRKVPDDPQVPTFPELGYKSRLLSGWFAFYAPAGIPAEVKDALVRAVAKAIKNPDTTAKLNKMGYVVDYQPPDELRKIAREEYEKGCEIAVKIGMRKK
ncbi:MAG: tripartite tricarboxylate transporter substrate binding protein [Pseudomonadota bacterium]